MKTIAISCWLMVLLSTAVFAQQKYKVSNCIIQFSSETLLENIEAMTRDGKGMVDPSSGNFIFRIPIKSFQFKRQLMEDHFNENYMESEKFPVAEFKGRIEGVYDLSRTGTYDVQAEGDISIHGVTRKNRISVSIEVRDGAATIKSRFNVKLADYKIEIPTIVFNKIAEIVAVTVEGELIKI